MNKFELEFFGVSLKAHGAAVCVMLCRRIRLPTKH